MDITLTNTATSSGMYDSSPVEITSVALDTLIVSGLTITKSADKNVWINGPLTYTITITNNASESFVDPIITDVLDPTLIVLVDNSVEYNGLPIAYTYNSVTGTLTVDITSIASGDDGILTFQVTQV